MAAASGDGPADRSRRTGDASRARRTRSKRVRFAVEPFRVVRLGLYANVRDV